MTTCSAALFKMSPRDNSSFVMGSATVGIEAVVSPGVGRPHAADTKPEQSLR